MITMCWGAKGGSGTTVVAASLALSSPRSTLIVDLGGDLPLVFGIPEPDGPGVGEWLASTAPADRLDTLTVRLTDGLRLLPLGRLTDERRLPDLAHALTEVPDNVVIDAGTGQPPRALRSVADRSWLVTRLCYLSLQRAATDGAPPDGVVVVEEPGRSIRVSDVETSIGAPVIARLLLDPAVARAVDSGLLLTRLPRVFRRTLEAAA